MQTIRTRFAFSAVVAVLLTLFLFGCAAQQQQQPGEEPADTTGQAVMEQARQDSIQAAREEARQDSIQAAQERERQRIEQERIERQRREQERKEQQAMESLRTIYFGFDQSNLTAQARENLQHNAEVLSKYKDWTIVVEGHTDERGSTEYNLALGERRADTVRQYYIDYGIAAERIEMVSYGEERPVVQGSGEEVWSQNRRAETVVK